MLSDIVSGIAQSGQSLYEDIKEEFTKDGPSFMGEFRNSFNDQFQKRRMSLVDGLRTSFREHVQHRRASCSHPESGRPPPAVPNILSTSAAVNSRLFLMGGIETTPRIPSKRKTSIPLSMHEDDYFALLAQRCLQWSVSPHRTLSTSSNDNPDIVFDHVCPYINGEDICRECNVQRKRRTFESKLGKLFVMLEYLEEEEKISVIISQYGNTKIDGHDQKKKPNVHIQKKITFADGTTKKVVKELDWCTSKDDYKFNYLTLFDCETLSLARKATLEIKVKYKRAFYKGRKVLKKLRLDLSHLETDILNPEEHRLF